MCAKLITHQGINFVEQYIYVIINTPNWSQQNSPKQVKNNNFAKPRVNEIL